MLIRPISYEEAKVIRKELSKIIKAENKRKNSALPRACPTSADIQDVINLYIFKKKDKGDTIYWKGFNR